MKYENASAAKGAAQIVRMTTDPKTNVLVYVAPYAASDTSDNLVYTADGISHEVPITVTTATAPPTLASPEFYVQSFKTLFALFIIAVVLESGLAVIFNWRPFLLLFDGRGVRTIVAVVVAYIFVQEFDIDLVTGLMNIYSGSSVPLNLPGMVITALVIAGGGSGVNNLLVSLGFRSVKTDQRMTPKPPPTQAWVSVRLIRKSAKGLVNVLIGPVGGVPQVAGSISGSSSGNSLYRFLSARLGPVSHCWWAHSYSGATDRD